MSILNRFIYLVFYENIRLHATTEVLTFIKMHFGDYKAMFENM